MSPKRHDDRSPRPEDGTADGATGDLADGAREPTDTERAAWARVRHAATGMTHHEAKSALEAARADTGKTDLSGTDAERVRAELAEWKRVTGTLADHAGAYDPDLDPFVQGELAARAHHGRTTPRGRRP
ncbi:hypothetical protein ACFY93_32720 [Streptomyces sp. NPDC008313]|uniref:hypothetical protein n=1 Tax=Streptomyces sp. NPDC008313 TaxID=3364826 RepID=UPI0036E8270A